MNKVIDYFPETFMDILSWQNKYNYGKYMVQLFVKRLPAWHNAA